jgi:hypothetical protein
MDCPFFVPCSMEIQGCFCTHAVLNMEIMSRVFYGLKIQI